MTSTTLKDLQEKLHEQMLYDKASAYTAGADKNAPKLAVIFPGIGYTADKPLLYYTTRLAKNTAIRFRPCLMARSLKTSEAILPK